MMAGRKKLYVVWNTARNEGVIFRDKFDAASAVSGKEHRRHGYPSFATVASAFFEAYGDEGLKVEAIDATALEPNHV